VTKKVTPWRFEHCGMQALSRSSSLGWMDACLAYLGVPHTTTEYQDFNIGAFHILMRSTSGIEPITVEWANAGGCPAMRLECIFTAAHVAEWIWLAQVISGWMGTTTPMILPAESAHLCCTPGIKSSLLNRSRVS
jgi:hypothetical protein